MSNDLQPFMSVNSVVLLETSTKVFYIYKVLIRWPEFFIDLFIGQIDGGEFLEAYTTADKLSQRPNLLSDKKEDISNGAFDGVWHRPVVDLLVEQVFIKLF